MIGMELHNGKKLLLVFKENDIVQAVTHDFALQDGSLMRDSRLWSFHEFSDGVYEIGRADFKSTSKKFIAHWIRSDNSEVKLVS